MRDVCCDGWCVQRVRMRVYAGAWMCVVISGVSSVHVRVHLRLRDVRCA